MCAHAALLSVKVTAGISYAALHNAGPFVMKLPIFVSVPKARAGVISSVKYQFLLWTGMLRRAVQRAPQAGVDGDQLLGCDMIQKPFSLCGCLFFVQLSVEKALQYDIFYSCANVLTCSFWPLDGDCLSWKITCIKLVNSVLLAF